jgi:metal-responsive CopG/Arc/MetJ family transcriptional regulator
MGYNRKRIDERVVFLISQEDLKRIDEWGIPAGMPNRSQAIRELIARGLSASNETIETQKGSVTA